MKPDTRTKFIEPPASLRKTTFSLLAFLAVASAGQASDLSSPTRDGLLAWYDASDPQSAVTKTEGSNGDTITAWKDLSGQGHDFTQPADGHVKHIQENGVWSVWSNGGSLQCPGVNQSVPAMTFYAVVKSPVGNTPLITFDPDCHEFISVGWTTGNEPTLHSNGDKGGWAVAATREVEDGAWHLLTFVRDGKARRYYVDGVLAGSGSVNEDVPCAISDMALFGNKFAGSPDMHLAEMMIYGRAQNDAEVAQVNARLQQKWQAALSLQGHDLVAFVGNSISTGAYCGNGNTWSAFAGKKLGLKHWVNFSKGGITTPQIAALAAAEIDPIRKLTTGRGIMVFWEATNDIALNKISGAQALANVADFCAARKNAGWDKIVVLTVMPRGNVGAEFEPARLEFNDLLKKDYAKYGIDAVVDLGADPVLGAPGANNDKTYFRSDDQTHLTALGESHVADLTVKTLTDLGVKSEQASP